MKIDEKHANYWEKGVKTISYNHNLGTLSALPLWHPRLSLQKGENKRPGNLSMSEEHIGKNKRINVMHIRDSSGMYGAEQVILTLAKYINKDIFNFKLLCMKNEDGRSNTLIENAKKINIPVMSIDVKGRLDVRAIKTIKKLLITNQNTILHCHDYKSNFYGLWASRQLGIKRITTAHGSTRDSLLQKAYLFLDERVTYRFFDQIIAVSEDLREQLEKKNIPSRKIRVIQNGLDLRFAKNNSDIPKNESSLEMPGKSKVFAVIGRLYPDKGHRYFLQAFSKVQNRYPSIRGIIVGEGPERIEIERQVRELNLTEKIDQYGFRSDMKNVYRDIDCLIIPSLTEGLPYVLLEAMAFKIPVIATSVGDIPNLIEDNITGYLVPPGNDKRLEDKMMDILRDPRKSKTIGKRGAKFVTENFSHERMVTATEHLYMDTISK